MCKMYHGIKFENYVLISGVIEMIAFLFLKFFRIDFLSLLIQTLQIIITMFISRRFLKLYLTLGKKNLETHIYNYYFYVLVCINGIFILLSLAFYIVSCIPSITTKEETPVIRDDYVSYAHDTFSCIVSILLYISSLRIRKMIRISLLDLNTKKEEDYLKSFKAESKVKTFVTEDLGRDCEKANEIYLETRRIQLKLIAFANLFTDTIEFIMITIRLFFLDNSVKNEKLKTYPTDWGSYVVFLIEDLCFILSTFFNYICFYYLIRDSYQIEFIPNIERNLLDEDIEREVHTSKNESITNFLEN